MGEKFPQGPPVHATPAVQHVCVGPFVNAHSLEALEGPFRSGGKNVIPVSGQKCAPCTGSKHDVREIHRVEPILALGKLTRSAHYTVPQTILGKDYSTSNNYQKGS